MRYLLFLVSLIFTACSVYAPAVCPPPLNPSQEALDAIKSLNNSEVDAFIENVYKTNQKLHSCTKLYPQKENDGNQSN